MVSAMAEWSVQYINNLPDAAFAWIEPGGEKDDEGKTVPRTLRHLPHHNASVTNPNDDASVDRAHLRNALARASQVQGLPSSALSHLQRHAERLGIGVAAETQESVKEESLREYVAASAGAVRDGVIHGVSVIREKSANGFRYTREALRAAVPLFEGAKVYANHADGIRRDVRDTIGILRAARYEEDAQGAVVRADLHVFESVAAWLLEAAEKAPDALGLSINGRGRARKRYGEEVVEEITAIRSVDIVAEPATVSGLFEEKRKDEERKMDLEKRVKDLEEQVRTLEADIAKREEAMKALKEENDEFKAKAALAEKKAKVDAVIKEAKLPEEAVTDVFRESLLEADEERMKKLIEDRVEMVKKAGGLKPSSKRRDEEDLKEDVRGKGGEEAKLEDYVAAVRS